MCRFSFSTWFTNQSKFLSFYITNFMIVLFCLCERRVKLMKEYDVNLELGSTDDIKTVMGKIVLIAWLFVTGIVYSCYTANLSAILTAPRLEPTLNDIDSVLASKVNIGYQKGSYAEKYLKNQFKIDEQRLIALNTESEYYNALSNGEVGAIIDQRPYMQSLVANHCSNLTFAGQTFTTQNWGFVSDF